MAWKSSFRKITG